MDKKTTQKVLMVSGCFLLFVAGMAFVLKRMNPRDEMATAQTQEKIVYLTFDDGPSKNTQPILDILDQYQVKATFFVTGIQPDYTSMIKEEANRGHAIGIHTFSHEYKEIYASKEAYFKDIDKANQMIKQQIGTTTPLLRFPGGASNTVSRKFCQGIMSLLSKEVQSRGYQYYDWNAENGDGNSHLDADTLVNKASKEVKGKDSVMMLMHDGGGNDATVQALPRILEALKKQGYQFRVIDATTPVFHHHIAN